VKRFSFRLESLQRWRMTQRDREMAALELLLAERARLLREESELEQALLASRVFVRRTPEAEAEELHAADRYLRYAIQQRRRLKSAEAELDQRIDSQRKVLVEAERRVDVLDQLRTQQHAAWRRELDKEQESLVAELVVARWHRQQ
jgi:flagellar export protein FliJ